MWPPVTLLPSHEPGEWGRTVTTHPHPLPRRLSSPARVLLLTSLHTLHIPFGAEETDCNQVCFSSSFPFFSIFVSLSHRLPAQPDHHERSEEIQSVLHCHSSFNQQGFWGHGVMGKSLPLESVAVLREDETRNQQPLVPTEDPGLPPK